MQREHPTAVIRKFLEGVTYRDKSGWTDGYSLVMYREWVAHWESGVIVVEYSSEFKCKGILTGMVVLSGYPYREATK